MLYFFLGSCDRPLAVPQSRPFRMEIRLGADREPGYMSSSPRAGHGDLVSMFHFH
jgi:hypothetical protein